MTTHRFRVTSSFTFYADSCEIVFWHARLCYLNVFLQHYSGEKAGSGRKIQVTTRLLCATFLQGQMTALTKPDYRYVTLDSPWPVTNFDDHSI